MATKEQDTEQRAEAIKALEKVADLLDQADAQFQQLASALGVTLDGEPGERVAVAKGREFEREGVDRSLAGLLS